jgi:hypothetical protein
VSREQQSADVNSDAHDENGVDLTLIRWMLSLTLHELRDLNLPELG